MLININTFENVPNCSDNNTIMALIIAITKRDLLLF